MSGFLACEMSAFPIRAPDDLRLPVGTSSRREDGGTGALRSRRARRHRRAVLVLVDLHLGPHVVAPVPLRRDLQPPAAVGDAVVVADRPLGLPAEDVGQLRFAFSEGTRGEKTLFASFGGTANIALNRGSSNIAEDSYSPLHQSTWAELLKRRITRLSGRRPPSWSIGMIEASLFLQVDFSDGPRLISGADDVALFFDRIVAHVRQRNPILERGS